MDKTISEAKWMVVNNIDFEYIGKDIFPKEYNLSFFKGKDSSEELYFIDKRNNQNIFLKNELIPQEKSLNNEIILMIDQPIIEKQYSINIILHSNDVEIKMENLLTIIINVLKDNPQKEEKIFEKNKNEFVKKFLKFIDLSKVSTEPTKISLNEKKICNAPPLYKTVGNGMNFFGICKATRCKAYNKEVVYMFGYGTFNLINDRINIVCPVCRKIFVINRCGFLDCKYSYVGKKVENDKVKIVEYSNKNIKKDIFDFFEIRNNLCIELKITVDRL